MSGETREPDAYVPSAGGIGWRFTRPTKRGVVLALSAEFGCDTSNDLLPLYIGWPQTSGHDAIDVTERDESDGDVLVFSRSDMERVRAHDRAEVRKAIEEVRATVNAMKDAKGWDGIVAKLIAPACSEVLDGVLDHLTNEQRPTPEGIGRTPGVAAPTVEESTHST